MLSNNTNITDKKYKKIAIQVSLNGFSFCCFDTLSNTITAVKEIVFDITDMSAKIENLFNKARFENPELAEKYDDIVVLHDNTFSTFVPTPLFDEQFLGSYLQYDTKVFLTDFFAYDQMVTYQMNNVYIPYVNINNYFVDELGIFTYKHVNTILVSKLLEASKNIDEKKMFVYMAKDHFEIIIVENQHLLLFNSFEYKTPEDLIYYLLFTSEQLNMNPEYFNLEFLGTISEDDAYFKIVYKYIRNVSLFDVSEVQKNNSFSKAENLKHFILFQS